MSKPKEIFLPSLDKEIGAIHPINQVKFDLIKLLTSFGFEVAEGPEIESEEFNFDMLNIPATHPAREMHDTFYVDGMKKVLRTHTSPVQVRTMLASKPPIAVVSPGKVYRKDDDATHLPMFHQIEGLYVDENVNFAHLKDLIYKICHSLFGEEAQLRFRPSYFPFTEPSAEVDVLFGDKWLEILGCGVVNPKVLDNCGIDPQKYSGLAFGLGIERIAMLKYEVKDIRDFYKSNLDFLRQFK
ncbi:phenylalanine--tRNA ligase subunit alpha [SAR86 cluster bacterium]|nr:phenylalanine--tRNA ligase subunit alpha [SAR86 cluster bacterium]